MKRLLGSVYKDALLQYRNGFYLVGAFVVVFYLGLLRQIPDHWLVNLPQVIPAVLLLNAFITTFYFIAALVLLEQAEGTLPALAATPLRTGEYLSAKVISLTVLALAENVAILLFFYGFDFDPWLLALGLVSLCALYTLVGFAAISRFRSINSYLIPSSFLVAFLLLPLLGHFGFVDSGFMYAHPVQPSLSLLRAAFIPVPTIEVAYALAGAALSTTASFLIARRAFTSLALR